MRNCFHLQGSDQDEQIIIEYVSAPLEIEQSEEPVADEESAYIQGLGYAPPKVGLPQQCHMLLGYVPAS
jgi:hypothetical protein